MAVPFVVEVATCLRRKLLHRPGIELEVLQAQVTEPAYERIGGSAYLAIRESVAEVQTRYLAAFMRARTETVPELQSLQRAMSAEQVKFSAFRARIDPLVAQAQSEAIAAHWASHPAERIPDAFFADVPLDGPLATLQRIHPPWWGQFMVHLRRVVNRGHPAEGLLLDALPRLREKATKKTLAAIIDEWFEENGPKWGWTRRPHDRMLLRRAAMKAAQLCASLDDWAPDFRTRVEVQNSLAVALTRHLAEFDPWKGLIPASQRVA